MDNTDLEPINGENITPQDVKNSEEINSAQISFSGRVLLGLVSFANTVKEDILGILPKKDPHPSEMIKMLEEKRKMAINILDDNDIVKNEAVNDDDFNMAA